MTQPLFSDPDALACLRRRYRIHKLSLIRSTLGNVNGETVTVHVSSKRWKR